MRYWQRKSFQFNLRNIEGFLKNVYQHKTKQIEETEAVDFCWLLNCSKIDLLFSFTCWEQQAT